MQNSHIQSLVSKEAKRLSKSINRFWKDKDSNKLLKRAKWCISDALKGRCENEAAAANMEYFIFMELKKIDLVSYEKLHPPCYMDAKGNYTFDSSKWA
jgi:hypothetical protein